MMRLISISILSYLFATLVSAEITTELHSTLRSHPLFLVSRTIASDGQVYPVCVGSKQYYLEAKLYPRLDIALSKQTFFEFASDRGWKPVYLSDQHDGLIGATLSDGSPIYAQFPQSNGASAHTYIILKAEINHPNMDQWYPSYVGKLTEFDGLGTPVMQSIEKFTGSQYGATLILKLDPLIEEPLKLARRRLRNSGWDDLFNANHPGIDLDAILENKRVVAMKRPGLMLWLSQVHENQNSLINISIQSRRPSPDEYSGL